MVRSTISCGSRFRFTLTSRTRDLPYRFQESTLRAPIRRVAEGTEQQRNVVVLLGVLDVERDPYFRKKIDVQAHVALIGGDVERQPIRAGRDRSVAERHDAP